MVAEAGLSREHGQVNRFFLLIKAHKRLVVILLSPLHIFLGSGVVAYLLMDRGTDHPKLSRILLGDRLGYVVQNFQGFCVLLLADAADDRVVRVFVDVEGAESDIRKICLATRIACIVSIGTIRVFIVRELVLRVEYFVSVHDLGALVKVFDPFVVLARVDMHDTTVQIIVLLIEDVLLVVVSLLSLLCIGFIIAFVGSLGGIGSSLELPVELDDFLRVQV